MAVNATGVSIADNFNEFILYGTFTLTGSYGTASSHGDTFNLQIPVQGLFVGSDQLPFLVEINEVPPAGTAPSGDVVGFGIGTNQTNGVVTVMTASGTELSEGSAYSGALTTSTFQFAAHFPKFQ